MRRLFPILLSALALTILAADTAQAQFRRPGGRGSGGPGGGGRPSFGGSSMYASMVDRLDANRDGQIDSRELANSRGLGSYVERNRIRTPISRDDAVKLVPKMFEDYRRQREESRGEDRDRDRDRDRDDRDRDRGDSDRSRYSRYDRDRRDDGKGKKSSSKSTKKSPPPRVTVDMPDKFKEGDMNQDGQLALFEWRQWKPKETGRFFALDANKDGFLTARELVIAEKHPPLEDELAALVGPAETSKKSDGDSRSGDSKDTKPAADKKPDSPAEATDDDDLIPLEAKYVFRQLDRNKNGEISDDEWRRSQSARRNFEKAGIRFERPANLEQFTAVYPKKRLYPSLSARMLK